MDNALFDIPDSWPPPLVDPLKGLNRRQRLTARQQLSLDSGTHPITHVPLHPDAAPAGDRTAPGLRCGDCALLVRNHFQYLKCGARNGRLMTRGTATDVRRWYPACELFEPVPTDTSKES
jgi:hypothetical protein